MFMNATKFGGELLKGKLVDAMMVWNFVNNAKGFDTMFQNTMLSGRPPFNDITGPGSFNGFEAIRIKYKLDVEL